MNRPSLACEISVVWIFLYDCEHETAIFSLYDQSQEAAV